MLRRLVYTMSRPIKTLSASSAAALDEALMSPANGFSIDQLMELAGLSVSQAVYKVHSPHRGSRVLVVCGPGNNGGDGLVCARHLYHYGYHPTIYYPKASKPDLFSRLQTQLKVLHIPFTDDFDAGLQSADLVVDALFGFSFKPPVREPFVHVIEALESTPKPVLSVDIPSCWDVEAGPPRESELGSRFMPQYLISLTAPKPCVKYFKGSTHFVGGRFLGVAVAEKFGLDVPHYEGIEQIVEMPIGDGKIEKL